MADTHETIADIIAWLRRPREGENAYLTLWRDEIADRIEAAHKRELETKDSVIQTLSAARDDELNRHRHEMEALKRRRSELDAEVAAKDEVIKRLNDAISEEQKRKMATTENPSAVGDAAKLREALKIIRGMTKEELEDLKDISDEVRADFVSIVGWCDHALAAPPRNCDVGVPEERIQRWSKFCKARSKKLPPIHGFEWEDYPYEEGGAK